MNWKMATSCPQRDMLHSAASGLTDDIETIGATFSPIVFCVALKHSQSMHDAHACVEPVMVKLCQTLLRGTLPASNWEERLLHETVCHCDTSRPSDTGESNEASDAGGQSLIAGVPRIAKRRAIAQSLASLELPDLIASVLRYNYERDTSEIATLIDSPEETVAEKLCVVDEALRNAISQIEGK